MKIRLVVTLVGLAIGFTAPAFAQQKDAPDPALVKAAAHSCQVYDDVYNNNDPEALANLFTEDAVLVTDSGIFHGRDEILKYQTAIFKDCHFSDHKGVADLASVRPIKNEWKAVLGHWNMEPEAFIPRRSCSANVRILVSDCLDGRDRQRRNADLEHHSGPGACSDEIDLKTSHYRYGWQ